MNQDIWNELKNELKGRLSNFQYNQWIAPIKADLDDNCLTLFCPNKMIKNYIDKTLLATIEESLSSLSPNTNVKLEISNTSSIVANKKIAKAISADKNENLYTKPNKTNSTLTASKESSIPEKNESEANKNNIKKTQKKLANTTKVKSRTIQTISLLDDQEQSAEEIENTTKLMKSKTFSNYVTGSSNCIACAAAKGASANPNDPQYTPMFLVGQSGLGKTHLLWAMGNEICKNFPDKKVIYVTSSDFMNDFVKILQREDKTQKTAEMQEFYSSADVLLIDDIQAISHAMETLKQLFVIFNKIYQRQKLIVVTSDVIPNELKGIDYRMKSRFNGGSVFNIDPPDIEQRISITIQKAKEMKLSLAKNDKTDIATYIAQNCRNNVREIEGALKTIAVHINNSSYKETLTTSYVKNVLSGTFSNKNRSISPEKIIKIVSEYFHVTEKDLRSKKKYRTISYPRSIAMYLIRDLTGKSFPEIGELLSKHHTTVMHACETIAEKLNSNKELQDDYAKLLQLIQ